MEGHVTFDELYDQHFDFVWRSLRRLGVPPADLQDVAQEVFLVVHRRLPHFEARSKVTTWLFSISLHAARDRRRRAHVRREVADATLVEELVDRGADASLLLERRQDLELFEAALMSMDLEQRAVFTLFELEGVSGPEIAEALEIPLGTVYSRLRLAREAFRHAVLRSVSQHRSRELLGRVR
jgi:RNA polymerase sigma-70 factor, ECF subfamily